MALFVYTTPTCQTSAKKHSFSEALKTIAGKLEKEQNLALFDAFPPPYLVRKQFGSKQGRLIAARREIIIDGEEHLVVVLLDILIRGSNDYDSQGGFGHDPIGYGKNHFEPVLAKLEVTLADFIRDRTKTDPPPERPILSDYERVFLSEQVDTGKDNSDILVCETKNWIDRIQKDKDDLQLLAEIGNAILGLCLGSNTAPGYGIHALEQNAPKAIAFFWDPDAQRLTLLDLIDDSQNVDLFNADLQSEPPRAFRSYPAWMTMEDEKHRGMFVALERDTFGNMALSDEEQSVLHPNAGTLRFPLFVNGRAGSGKSTILQYLFAEFFARFAKSGKPFVNPPAYFACNKELVDKAREFVESILRHNPSYSKDNLVQQTFGDRAAYRGSFKVFREHLLSLLTSEERANRFQEDKYVDYSRFVRLWEEKFGQTQNARRDFGADISWHVIRTFVKGTSVDAIMEKDEYGLLPENQRSVSKGLFDTVYDKVWENWYRAKTVDAKEHGEGLWDDQDLVRYLLVNSRFESATAKFPGIFCDEAQDFTQIEIVVFLKMSAFSDRRIFPHEISSLPFVFAGDEFQTLNPTGFRWDAVKGMFHEKFIRGLCPSAKAELIDKDLKNNYRSVGEIVRFSNSIQLLRAARFNNRQLEPQHEWTDVQGHPIAFYDRDFTLLWEALKKRSDVHVIVPCHANEEIDFIRNDPKLKDVIAVDKETGTTNPRVLSSVRAKGLEYQCVVAYGFGNCLSTDVLASPISSTPWNSDADRMAMEYFLNRLYVAVSRPRNQLYIVDTKDGIKRLWTFARNKDSLSSIANSLPKAEEWMARTAPWVQGTLDMLKPTYTVDYRMLAEQDEKAADALQDASQMFQAATWYENIPDETKKVHECLAKAHLYRKEYQKAGSFFEESKEFGKAGDAYWRMCNSDGWRKMADLASRQPELSGRPQYVVAKTLSDNATQVIPTTLQYILNGIKTAGIDIYQTTEWRRCLSELTTRVSELSKQQLAESLPTVIALGKVGFSDGLEPIAKKAFESELYEEARRLMELSGDTESRRYHQAVAFTESYPTNLSSLNKLGSSQDERIIAGYDDHPVEKLDDEQLSIVASALFRSHRKGDGIQLCGRIESKQILDRMATGEQDGATRTVLQQLATVEHFKSITDRIRAQSISDLVKDNRFDDVFKVRILARAGSSNPEYDFGNEKPGIIGLVYKYLDDVAESRLKDIPYSEVGSAIELFGKHKTAVSFYERVLGENEDYSLRLRLFAARLKHLQFNKKQYSVQKFREEKQKLEADAKRLGIVLSEIPALPRNHGLEELKQILVGRYAESQNLTSHGTIANPDSTEPPKKLSTTAKTNTETVTPVQPEPEPPIKSVSYQGADFTIDGKFHIQWWPRKNRVQITIKDHESEYDGDQWTLDDGGVAGDGIDKLPPVETDEQSNAVQLPNTPFTAKVSRQTGIRVFNTQTGITILFAPAKS